MKKIMIFSVVISLTLLSCGKMKEAKEAMNAAKKVYDAAGDVAETAKSLEDIDIEKVKLNEKDVKKFYKAMNKLNEKYPEIHFQIATMAAVEASMAGKDLKSIIKKETDIPFAEYSQLSAVTAYVEIVGIGYEMTTAILEQTKETHLALKGKLGQAVSKEEKEQLEEQIKDIEESISNMKEEMKKEEFEIVKENFRIIKKVKEELDS